MKLDSIKIKRQNRVEADPKEYNSMNIAAFQFVKFEINFYGNQSVSILDTKITNCGRQIVIDGDGFIPAGLDITDLK